MGLFDNMKKKKEAKALDLTLEQYDEFLVAQTKGLSIADYKRFIASFANKYNMDQFVVYLKLEKSGFDAQQSHRYITELASKIQLEDYADFLEAEKLGLSVSEYATYSTTLKSRMSAVDYVGFLKAQKIGITMGKYLQYLKSFKGEMSIEEYNTYLKAEENGMDREHYTEYLEKFKDKYTIERYLAFDKARSLGMTLEEYDLRIEASNAGMTFEEYKLHQEAEKLGMSDEEYKVYSELGASNSVADDVLTIPTTLTTLPKNVFKQFSFRSVVFHSGIKEIADDSFEGCASLETVTIPSSVEKIGNRAFKNCAALKTVVIENGVTVIEDSAFEDCTSLVELVVPGSVKNVEYHAFFGCSSLKSLEFEKGVGSIDISEWADLKSLESVITPADLSITHLAPYRKSDTRVAIINKDKRFDANKESVTDYITEDKYDEYGLLENRDAIEFIEVNGDYVFLDLVGFPNLKTVSFSANGCIRSVDDCPELQLVLYNRFLAEIPGGLATTNKERENKIVASKTLSLGKINAPKLRFIAVENGAMVIDLNQYSTSKLAWVHIPESVSRLYLNTSAVSDIAVHGNCKINNENLADANIRRIRFDVDGRDEGVFSNTSAEGILSAEFASCDVFDFKLERTTFTADSMCAQKNVKSIVLPKNLCEIQELAFAEWGIEEITIPSTVTLVGNRAFSRCANLKKVVFEGVPSNFGYAIFEEALALESVQIDGQLLSATEFAEKYEVAPVEEVVVEEIADDEEVAIIPEDDYEDDIEEDAESVDEEQEERITVKVDGCFSMQIPASYTYSTDPTTIGDNRVLVAALGDESDLSDPYSAVESITVLRGKTFKNVSEIETLANELGLENSNIFVEDDGLNVRYAISEQSEELSIFLALICVGNTSYPTQFFFNGTTTKDLEQLVCNILVTVEEDYSSVPYEVNEDPEEIVSVDISVKYEVTTTSKERVVSNDVPSGVLYRPGEEPEALKKRINTLFEKLDEAYPDKVIVRLHKDHKKWGETVTDLYRKLGYSSGAEFLETYGYKMSDDKGGRPKADVDQVVVELKKRYPSGTSLSILEITEANPDLAAGMKTLQNQLAKSGGISFKKFLVQEGIILQNEGAEEEFEKLKARYEGKPYMGTALSLKEANADLDWKLIEKYCMSEKGMRVKPYLEECGILAGGGGDDAEKLATIEDAIKAKYANATVRPATLSEFEKDNPDINRGVLNRLTMSVYKESASDYLKRLGILSADSTEEKLARVMATLKERYVDGKKKAFSITDLREQNLDLPITTIGTWTKKLYNKNATEYLSEQGIISVYDWRYAEQVRREREEGERQREEERLQKELATPIETIYYTPKVYEVEDVSVSGKEAELWETEEYWASHPGEIFIKDYLGDASRVTIPTHINGKRVSNLASFALKKCKASIVQIPGSFEYVAGHLGYENTNIQTVIIGEGVKTIGESCFSFVKSLKNVCVSQSVIEVGRTAFEYTPWFESQKDYVIIGSVLVKMKDSCVVLNVPHGVKAVGEVVAVFNHRLRKVILPETVTTLYPSAFSGRGNENIQEFIFTDSLVNIGHFAFGRNKWTAQFDGKPMIINNQLLSYDTTESTVTVPDGVVKICDEAFKDNDKLRKVILPDSIKSLGVEAFSRCKNLTSINLPEGIERLEKGCFYDCKKLANVTIPDSVVYIGRSAFNSCAALTSFRISSGVEFVGEKAFLDCKNLATVVMNEKVSDIQREAFSGCSALTSITIPAGVSELKEYLFNGCKALTKVDCLGKITAIGSRVFYGCEALEEFTLAPSIGESSFCGCKSLIKIVFDDSITEIPNDCFAGCTSLEEIVIPDAVVKIGKNAFSGCTGIKKLVLPASLKEIGESAFNGCSSIETIVIPDAVETISDNAFKDCTKLLNVTMPASIANFGLDVFTNTPYMKKEFGDYVVVGGLLTKYLGTDKDVIIPEDVTVIGKNAFAEAYHVESIVIHDKVVKIEDQIFGEVYSWRDEGQPMLAKLVIGNGVTKIGKKAFANCGKLADVVFGKSIVEIEEEAFEGCKSIKSIDLSGTPIVTVGDSAFSGFYDAKTLLLPETIEYIGRDAFASIYADKIQLPKSVKKVERGAFANTKELVVYDNIDPDAVEASAWNYSEWNGSVNSPLACAMLSVSRGYVERQGNAGWSDYHITVLSATTGEIRYRIYCDSKEREDYRAIMFSAWGKNASFKFDKYDEYFVKTRNSEGRTEMAFCRLQYQEGLSADHKENYEAFMERCMYIERSARRTAKLIAKTDDVDRLQMLFDYNTIDEHNLAWVREEFEKAKANNCAKLLNEKFAG